MLIAIERVHFEQFREEYLDVIVSLFRHQPSGAEAIRCDLNLLSGYLHDESITKITGDTLLGFISHLRQSRGNQGSTVNRKISSIVNYFRYLRFKQVKGSERFPIESVPRVRTAYAGPMQVLSPEEVKRLLSGNDKNSVLGFRDFVLFSLLYRLGLRLGEALAIDLKDVDLDKQELLIHGKGRRQRTLPLVADLAALISQWLVLRTRLRGAKRLQALFISKKGNRLAARTAQESFQKLVAQTGPFRLVKITPHGLRHAFASHALEGEADLIVLKAIMGHAVMKSTEVYLHPSMKLLRQAVNDHPSSEILDNLIEEGAIVLTIQQKRRRRAA